MTRSHGLNGKFEAHQRLALAGTRADQHQVTWSDVRKQSVGRRHGGRFRRERAPGGKTLRPGDAVKRIMERIAIPARQAPGLSLQMIDRGRESHRQNLPLRAETQSLLMPGARTVGPMISSPDMRCAFPAEGGGVGGTGIENSRFRIGGERATRRRREVRQAAASGMSARVGPNSSSNAWRSAISTSAMVTSWPRSTSEVTP